MQREALVLADRLLEDFGDDPQALFLRGLLLAKWERREEAVRCWKACLRRTPEFAPAYACLGQQALDSGQFDEAVAPLRRAVELDPNLPDAGLSLGRALRNLGKDDEAIAVLERFLAKWPDSAEGQMELADAYLRSKTHEKAKAHFEKAARLSPLSSRAYYGLMMVAHKQGDARKAKEYGARFEELTKKSRPEARAEHVRHLGEREMPRVLADSYCEVGQFYAGHGRPSDAEKFWRRAAALDGQHVRCRRLLLSLYTQRGKVEEALQVVRDLQRIEPASVRNWLTGGALGAAIGKFDAAEAAFRKAIALAPEQAAAYAALAQLHLQTGGNLAEAKNLARTAVQLEPTARNYYLWSLACERNGDRRGALTAIQRAAELDPTSGVYRQCLERIQKGP